MAHLSEIIQKTYHKYSPIIEKAGVKFNLDFPDTTLTLGDDSHVAKALDKTMQSAVSRTRDGVINITVRKNQIVVEDTGTILSKTACELFTTEHIKVKSRVGFGTKVTIKW